MLVRESHDMGGPEMAPQSDQRSDRPGEPVAVLDVGLRSMTLRRAAGAAACREAAAEYSAAWASRAAQAWQGPPAGEALGPAAGAASAGGGGGGSAGWAG